MILPSRDPAAETAFVESLGDDLDGAIAAIELALREKRPLLAGRLVALLGDAPIEDPTIERARRALSMRVVGDDPYDLWADAFAEYRRRRHRRRGRNWRR